MKKLSLEEKIRIQYERACKKNTSTGIELYSKGSFGIQLQENESPIVKNTYSDSIYFITNLRVLKEKNGSLQEIVKHSDVIGAYWISENPSERMKLKLIIPQRIIILSKEKRIVIDDLIGGPLVRAYQWHIGQN